MADPTQAIAAFVIPAARLGDIECCIILAIVALVFIALYDRWQRIMGFA